MVIIHIIIIIVIINDIIIELLPMHVSIIINIFFIIIMITHDFDSH